MQMVKLNLLVVIGFVCLWSVQKCGASETTPEKFRPPTIGENLIRNPGFEDPTAKNVWSMNNWYKTPDGRMSEVAATPDSENPHSGKFSQRITVSKFVGSFVGFRQQLQSFEPGMAVHLQFWIRGPANTTPVQLIIRRSKPPYTTYFKSNVMLADKWREHVYTIILPKSFDPKNTQIYFILEEANTFWLDDVSAYALAPQASGMPLVGNRIPNGSFEVGRDHWCAEFRGTRGIGSRTEASNDAQATENNLFTDLDVVEVADAPHGHRVMHFPVRKESQVNLDSGFFPLRYGHPITVRFWLKASKPNLSFRAELGHEMFPLNQGHGQYFQSSKNGGWKQYSFTKTLPPSSSGSYFFQFFSNVPGEYWLDGVTVSEDPDTVTSTPVDGLNVGWVPDTQGHTANIFSKDQTVRFVINAERKPGVSTLNLIGRLDDAWDRLVKNIPMRIKLDANGQGHLKIKLPSNIYGAFKLSMYPSGKTTGIPLSELVYHIAPDLPDPGQVKDSFFGAHSLLTPYNLEIARRAGIRWLRLHPPLDTKWIVVEYEKGKFNFSTAAVKRASEMGFNVLGSLSSCAPHAVPEFFAKDPRRGRFRPGDWDAWKRYVQKTAEAFSPWIDHWEIWNEPDSGFLQVPPGEDKAKVYMKIVRTAREALTKTGLPVTVVGGGQAWISRPFQNKILADGIGKYLDILSFHHYGEWPKVYRKQLEHWKTYKNRSGKPIPLWITEASPHKSVTWLRTYGVQLNSPVTPLEMAGQMIQTMAALKAWGVRKHFIYSAFTRSAGTLVYRNRFNCLTEVNGIPHAGLVVHATAVRFLEGTVPEKFQEIEAGNTQVVYTSFLKGKKRIEVIWSRSPIAAKKVQGITLQGRSAFDLMGNSIAVQGLALSPIPVYLIGKSK